MITVGVATGVASAVGMVALVRAILLPPRLHVQARPDGLHVRLGLRDRCLCLRGDLLLPRAAIGEITVKAAEEVARTGLRLPGTSVPGLVRAGSFGRGERREFWDVRRAPSYLVVELRPGAAYRRVVLEVRDAEALREQLSRA